MFTSAPTKELDLDEALEHVSSGGAFVDLRDVDSYLDVHIRGSLELFYEWGPGMAARARDCIPLTTPLVLLDLGVGDVDHAAASLRGKGFDVAGRLGEGINKWSQRFGPPASTDVAAGDLPPVGRVLHVGDPGARPTEGAIHIPIERLWNGVDELERGRIVVAAGYGIRAALAVGILERAGFAEIAFWRTRR